MITLLKRDIYETSPYKHHITGIKFRGRIRKFCLEKGKNVLVENTQDKEDYVRFAILEGESADSIITYIQEIVPGTKVQLIEKNVSNPVLSKMSVNKKERYTL